MAGKGFDELTAHLKLKFRQRTDLASVGGVNFYEKWINDGYKWLTTRDRFWNRKLNFKFPQLEEIYTALATTEDTAYATIPSSTLYTMEMYDRTSTVALNWMNPKDYIRRTDRADSNSYSSPQEWCRLGAYYYFWPTPDAAYNLDILRRKIPDPLDGTNTTEIGEEWDSAILYLSAWIGYDWLGEVARADRERENFMEYTDGLIGIYYNEEKAGHKQYGIHAQARDYSYGR